MKKLGLNWCMLVKQVEKIGILGWIRNQRNKSSETGELLIKCPLVYLQV